MRTAAIAAMGIALLSGAAAAQPASDLERGVELRRSGRPAEAAQVLEAVAKAHPQDADVWLNLGLAYAASSRLDAAEQALDQAARLSPDYVDVRIARARVAYFRNDHAEAERRLAAVLAADPQNAEARELAAALTAARAGSGLRWRFDAVVSAAGLSKGLASEQGGYVALTRTSAEGRFATVAVEHRRRFDREDTYGEVSFGGRLGYLAFGATPGADFRPEWSVRGGLSHAPRALGGGWTAALGLDAVWSRYPVGDVRTLAPTLSVARGEGLALTGRWINVVDERDEHRSGYAVRAAWRPAPRAQLAAGWSDAPESSDGVTVKVRSASLDAAYDLAPRTTLRIGAVHEERKAYDRDELTLGITQRF